MTLDQTVTSTLATAPWRASAVVHQVYPRSFADSNGDGIGDLPGLITRLDHLRRLGVDVLELPGLRAGIGAAADPDPV